jgi:D-methionine transport system ATP-binding protein
MIEIRGLEKSFDGVKILNSIDLNIEDGDIFGLIGRSGVGKSTLLRCINGLESYDAGSLKVDGKEVKDLAGLELREYRKGVGMIFQHFSLTERDTVYQNIALPMKCWKYDKNKIKETVERLLGIVELEDKQKAKSRNLSGGQKQRVAIARALTLDPTILLCDEATSALDPNTTQSILALLKEINEKFGITIIVVTHEMSVIRQICNKVAILDKNGVADSGTVEDVFMGHCDALQELLGEKENTVYPESGTTLRFYYSSSTMDQKIVSRMATETGVNFDLLDAKTEQYRTGVLGDFIINVSAEDEEKILSYMKENHISWEVLHR